MGFYSSFEQVFVMNKFLIFVLISLFVLGLVFTSGCTDGQDNEQADGSVVNVNDFQSTAVNGTDDVLMPPALPE